MLIFSTSSFATKSNASFILSKAPSEAFIFLKVSLSSSHAPFFKAVQPCTIRVMEAFHLLQVFSGWRFLLPLTLYSCLLFFIGQLNFLAFDLSQEKIPYPTQIWFFSHHFPHSSPIRLLFHNLPPLNICQWFFSFCLQVFVETHLTRLVVKASSPSSPLPTPAAKS